MGNKEVKILCYADDAMLVNKSENDLQRLLYQFNKTAKKFNMIMSAANTKSMTMSKAPIKCKLVVDDKIISKERKFKWIYVDAKMLRQE